MMPDPHTRRFRMVDRDVRVSFHGGSDAQRREATDWIEKVFCHFTEDKAGLAKRSPGPPSTKAPPGVASSQEARPAPLYEDQYGGRIALLPLQDRRLHFRCDLPRPGSPVEHRFLSTVEEKIANSVISSLTDYLWIHGACLAKGTKTVFLVGPSGFGKTTTALALVGRGYELLTDDVVLLSLAEKTVVPFPRCPKVRGDAIERLGRSGMDLRREAELIGRYVILPARHFQYSNRRPARDETKVFFLTRGRMPVDVEAITYSEGLIGLSKQANILYNDPELTLVDQVFGPSSFHRIAVRDGADSLDAILSVVGSSDDVPTFA